MNIKKRTKIIATIGPSSQNYETLKTLILEGVTTIRANFSHGDIAEQFAKFDLAEKISEELNIPISLMLDTKGPEIRIGKMLDGIQPINAGSIVKIHTTEEAFKNLLGTSQEISVSYAMDKDLKPGNLVVIDDGKLRTVVKEVHEGYILVEAINSHKVKTNKRINLPGVEFSLPFLAEKDINDIKAGIKRGIDYIAASFTNNKENILELRQLLRENGGENIQIIAKIESHVGVQKIDEIIEYSDGIMIARGDLGLEIPYQDVPYYQKEIIKKCRLLGKPVIVATQMLDSMENSPQPTRAEVSDVYWATELGADATMLSGESAQGLFPIEAVKTMATINSRAEEEFFNKVSYKQRLEVMGNELLTIKTTSLDPKVLQRKYFAKHLAEMVYADKEIKYAVVLSRTGELLKEIARFRPHVYVVGVLKDTTKTKAFGITSSVFVTKHHDFDNIKADVNNAKNCLVEYGAKSGDKFVVVENDKITLLTF